MSSTPYLARRLRLIDEYFETETLKGWRAIIEHWTRPPPPPKPVHDPNVIRLNCVACGNPMRLQKKDMAGKEKAKVKCPNDKCGKMMEIAPRPPDKAEVKRIIKPPPPGLRISCPACKGSMVVPAAATAGKAEVNVRCPTEACRKVLTVKLPEPGAPALAKEGEAPPPQPKRKAPRPEETAE